MITFAIPRRTPEPVTDFLSAKSAELPFKARQEFYEDWHGRASFAPGTYILTGLEWADSEMRAWLSRVRRELSGRSDIRFLNDGRTLGRHDLLRVLEHTGQNAFRVRRLDADWSQLKFPVFVRSEADHNGPLSPLLHSPREVEHAIAYAMFGGYEVDDLLVVEFLDTSNETGQFVKYSAFFVGDRIIPRHMLTANAWMLKHESGEYHEESARVEREYLYQNPHRDEIAAICALAGAEFGRIDYTMVRGRINTWEINLNPTFGGTSPAKSEKQRINRARRADITKLFYERLIDAFNAMDLPSDGPAIPVSLAAPRMRTMPHVHARFRRVEKFTNRLAFAAPLLRLAGKAVVLAARAEARLG